MCKLLSTIVNRLLGAEMFTKTNIDYGTPFYAFEHVKRVGCVFEYMISISFVFKKYFILIKLNNM